MINLLPPKEKEKLFWEKRKRMTFILEILVFFCLLFLYLSFLALKINIEIQKDIIKSRIEKERLNISQIQTIKKEVNSLNKTLKLINKIYKEQVFASDLLSQIGEILPKDAYLSYFYFDKKENKLQIVGRVATLASLNQLKDALKNQPFFEKVQFSIGTYIPGQAIEFHANFTLKQ